MELISRAVLRVVFFLAVVLLLSPYEAWLEGAVALVIVGTVVVDFSFASRARKFSTCEPQYK